MTRIKWAFFMLSLCVGQSVFGGVSARELDQQAANFLAKILFHKKPVDLKRAKKYEAQLAAKIESNKKKYSEDLVWNMKRHRALLRWLIQDCPVFHSFQNQMKKYTEEQAARGAVTDEILQRFLLWRMDKVRGTSIAERDRDAVLDRLKLMAEGFRSDERGRNIANALEQMRMHPGLIQGRQDPFYSRGTRFNVENAVEGVLFALEQEAKIYQDRERFGVAAALLPESSSKPGMFSFGKDFAKYAAILGVILLISDMASNGKFAVLPRAFKAGVKGAKDIYAYIKRFFSQQKVSRSLSDDEIKLLTELIEEGKNHKS